MAAGEEQLQFESLLRNLLNAVNETRTQAEQHYEAVPPGTKIPFLVVTMKNSNVEVEVRVLAAVLLRRLFSTSFDDFWPQLTPEAQTSLKQELLLLVQEEKNPEFSKKVAECLAEFAKNMLDDDGQNTWPDILKFLFECAGSQDPQLKQSALYIFSIVPGIFGVQQSQYLNIIKQMLQQNLADQINKNVRYTAAKAAMSFILANEDQHQILNHLKDLLPAILQTVASSVEDQEQDTLIKYLIDLAESTPKFLRSQLDNIVGMCLKIVSNTELGDSWRQLALEVIVTLAESAPAMVRKNSKFLTDLIPQVLAMMVDLEDEPDWSTSDDPDDDEDNDSNAVAAESALDRLACALGGKTMLPHIISHIPPMLSNSDWRYRHAALMAISACGEGCHKQMEEMLGNIMDATLPYLQDPHPRVRYAACNALGQMATDFGPTFQKKFHDKVVPGLLLVMDDNDNPRVQAHAGAALVNFSEECPKNILAQYLDTIIAKLEQVLTAKFKELMEKGCKLVLEQVVTTLASVADTAEEKFVQYYDRFMPCLKYIVQNAVRPELRLLRGKTIECISLIGLAVGSTKFMQDCSDVMQLLLKTQTELGDIPEDDPQMSYMISAWARMCKIMGSEFAQYLPMVIGPVLKAAMIKPEVALLDTDDMKSVEGDSDWQFVNIGDQQNFGIRTAGLEEKATACQMLVCYARELKEGFAEYAEEVVKIMVPHLTFYFHDGVRIAAAESLPCLLDCAKIRGPDYLVSMWQYICPELLKAIENEPELDIQSEHMHSLAQCIEKMGRGCFTEEQMQELVKILNTILTKHDERQTTRQEQRKDEDYDEIVEEALLDEDDQDVYLLSKVSDIMHALFGTYKETILPVFEQLLPHFVKLLEPGRPWPDKQWALCIFDDLVEHTGPHSMKYQQCFLQTLIQLVCDNQPEVRQAAAYGVGVLAQFGGQGYSQALSDAVPRLLQVIQDENSRAVENLSPTENAISAITKICKYSPQSVNLDDILPHWLSWLPVWDDEDEAVHIYGYLCDLVESNNPLILNDNNQNLPRILGIIAEAFHKEAVSTETETYKRMVNIVRHVQSSPKLFELCLAQLNPNQVAALQRALSG